MCEGCAIQCAHGPHLPCRTRPTCRHLFLTARSIEIEGGTELPVLDGSALGWAMEIQFSGVRVAPLVDGTTEGVRRMALQVRLFSVWAQTCRWAWGAQYPIAATPPNHHHHQTHTLFAVLCATHHGSFMALMLTRTCACMPCALRPQVTRPLTIMSDKGDGGFISFVPEPTMRLTAGVDHAEVAPVGAW